MTKNAPHNGSLNPKQHALLTALVGGASVEQAAKTANVSPRTAYRWQRELPFQDALKVAEGAAFEKTLRLLMTGTSTALKVLLEAMTDKKCPYAVRVTAARVWLENALTLHKVEELENTLAEVQHLLKGDRYVPL